MTNEIIGFIDRISIGSVDVIDQFDLIFYQKSIIFVYFEWMKSYEIQIQFIYTLHGAQI